MSIKQQLFNSFIKGIGKTFGTAIVFGFFGTVFYMYSNNQSYIKNDQEFNENGHENDNENDHEQSNTKDDTNTKNVIDTIDDTDENDLNNNYTETNTEDLEHLINSKYKTLFENLLK
jgi:hypothetical protein